MEKDFQEELKQKAKSLNELLEKTLDSKAAAFNLTAKNDVYESKYYQLTGRIKSEKGLKEKFVRNNLILKLITDLKIKGEADLKELNTKNSIKEWLLKNVDDLIGLRIVTDLEHDDVEVIKLLRNNVILFENDAIKFLDLDNQPQKMRNGFSIYRIKGIFKEKYPFELQIKSRLILAWGEFDHFMFYKDYSFSPVKDNAQIAMNHVGSVLLQLEDLLLNIRKSNAHYRSKADYYIFMEWLTNKYLNVLKSKFGFGYRIDNISDELFFFYKKYVLGKRTIAKLNFNQLKFKSKDPYVKKYLALRSLSFDDQISELLYFNWASLKEKTKSEKYDRNIKMYFQDLCVFIKQQLDKSDKSIRYNTEVTELFAIAVENNSVHFKTVNTYQNFFIIKSQAIGIEAKKDVLKLFETLVFNSLFEIPNTALNSSITDKKDEVLKLFNDIEPRLKEQLGKDSKLLRKIENIKIEIV